MAATKHVLKGYGFTGFDQFSLSLLEKSVETNDKQDKHTSEKYKEPKEKQEKEKKGMTEKEKAREKDKETPVELSLLGHTLLTLPTSFTTTDTFINNNSSWDSLFIHVISRNIKQSYVSKKWQPLLTKIISDYCIDEETIYRIYQLINSYYYIETTLDHCYLADDSQSQIITKLDSIPFLHIWSYVSDSHTIYYVTLTGNLYSIDNVTKNNLCTLLLRESSNSNKRLPLLDKVKGVTNGPNHTLILTNAGLVYSFGYGNHGQLGHGDLISRHTHPVLIEALAGVPIMGVACGGWHSLVVSGCGDMYSWGWNQDGQLGHSHTHSMIATPILVEGIPEETEIIKVSCGSRHSSGLSKDGLCFVWGWNEYGQLGGREETSAGEERKEGKERGIIRTPVLLSKDTVYDVMCCHWSTIIRTKL